MTEEYIPRPIKVVLLPVAEDYPFTFGPFTVLKFANGNHLDIGCICFLKHRFSAPGRQLVTGCTVELMSFSEDRIKIVQSLTKFFSVMKSLEASTDLLQFSSGRRHFAAFLIGVMIMINW